MATKVIVGGTFGAQGGRASSVVAKLAEALGSEWGCLNGGTLETLKGFSPDGLKALIWMPNISNDEQKLLERLKPQNPEMLLIQSKRVVEKDYTEADVIGRLLKSHSGLGIMITQAGGRYQFKLLDPLGNLWCQTDSIDDLARRLTARLDYLLGLTRYRSAGEPAESALEVPQEFVDLVKRFGTRFAEYVNAVNPNRLLGNASTRCAKGFPAVKLGDRILVTRRNVNKETLAPSDFVEARLAGNLVEYQGLHKPSVDTPVQLRLLAHYQNVNYMVHGHVYVAGGIMTRHKVPCGFVEEFDEITRLVPDPQAANFTINLWGHGCLIMAESLEYLEAQLPNLMGRPFPEG